MSDQEAQSSSLLRSSSIVSVMTLLSRVLGLVRDVVVAQYFGARADAFFVAFKIPNFFRRLFAEGAFTVAFVPVLGEYRAQRSLNEVRLFVAHMSGTLGTILLAVTVLAMLFADYLPWLFAPGFRSDAAKFALTGDLLRITFPYLLFISLAAFSSSVLNAYGRFAVPAFTPVILNVCLIASVWLLTPYFAEPLFALAWGVFIAGALQWLFQLPFLAQQRMLVWPKPNRQDDGVKRVGKLMLPALFGVSVSQINLLLDTLLASFLEDGSVSWLYYADRLNNLPLGIFAIAIAVVVLPSLSAQHASENRQRFADILDWAVRMVLLLALPAALALVMLATPLMATIFYHGEMTAYDIGKMALALQAYGSGLLAFMLIKVLAPGYYAQQDTKTPVRIGIQAMALNMVLNLLLVVPLQHVGLALATALSSYFNALMLYWGLRRNQTLALQQGWWRFLLKVLLALLLLAASVWWLMGDAQQWLQLSAWQRAQRMTWVVLGGVLVYFAALLMLGLRPRHLRGVRFE
ncbi:murein biosynthesis integral membrane protein MurJ [Bacterioplanes sanyensis]|uniref:Probable lipid II flippase MurJ n=1 Tax=Bacterioplanes sanyensis TaxID=1249553 RepID=A0A222FJU4_9GAMM|nr:murein biosynthesis integral membrane protein MurJ [Bacterioplanes sanyensis]ASP38912.1 murein biosynthesis integral membrane protein MurJ [Bacterioplanes sanyensis]